MATMSQDWQHPQLPDWAATAAAWVASLVAAGGAKPAFDWYRDRGRDAREAKREEINAATELREELRRTVREMDAKIDKRDTELDVLRREFYELLAKLAALTAENHALRAHDHKFRGWLAGFYGLLQMKWKEAGLPMDQFPPLPEWVMHSPEGPTASSREPGP